MGADIMDMKSVDNGKEEWISDWQNVFKKM